MLALCWSTLVEAQVQQSDSNQDNENETLDSDRPLVDIDGNTYPIVTIGDQIWMAENLRVTRYNDGTEIPNLVDEDQWSETTSGAWSFFREEENAEKFGLLYNWYTTVDEQGVCPDGWWVPSQEDFAELESFAGMPDDLLEREEDGGWGGAEENVAGKLKAVSELWRDPNEGATDEFGFAMIPGGARFAGGFFSEPPSIDAFASLWSTQESGDQAYRRLMRYDRTDVRRDPIPKNVGAYIRCVTDEFTVSAQNEEPIPTDIALHQNFPNPFNPSTVISYSVSNEAPVRISVYDMLGRQVAVLVNEMRVPGHYQVNFDASELSSGIYLYRLDVGSHSISRRMTLVK